MKKIILFTVMAMLCLNFWAKSQSAAGATDALKPLLIGDKVPDVELAKILNYKDSTIHLSQLRGKAVILDFWASYCTACLKEFPKMNALQNQYDKYLQILLINTYDKDSDTVLRNVVETRKQKGSFSLPVVKSSTALRKAFPVRSMPHYIWIGADGRIKAITRADEVTASNIDRFIAGLLINLTTKTN